MRIWQKKIGMSPARTGLLLAAGLLLTVGAVRPAMATAYGSLNNFDCVNDTGEETHGFEIELDYGHTKDVTYTYDYNHYGTPKITEDNSDPAHPRVFIRYESGKKPDGTWAAYTAIPSGPISPTQGHQFTDPSVNFGGEHFGVGFIGNPVAVKYHWLVDDHAGHLVLGPAVVISTPTFTYYPPVGNKPAHVQAEIEPQPAPPIMEFGPASWTKEIKTTSHNPKKVSLNNLVGDDAGKPQPWANGEKPEVETEWSILQQEFALGNGGKHGAHQGKEEDLPKGNEMVTRRYEFYKYTGPIDGETGEAVADEVAADGKHGVGKVTYADHIDPATGEWVTVTKDMSKVVVVGDFVGAQMAGFDVAPKLGLIDHVQDGAINVTFPDRLVVIGGPAAFTAKISVGALPAGMTLNSITGILGGKPTEGGNFSFTVEATDGTDTVSRAYSLSIAGGVPATYKVDLLASPAVGGSVTGDGRFKNGSTVTIGATANAGYAFLNWTENATVYSTSPNYSFKLKKDRSFVANFIETYDITVGGVPAAGGTAAGAGTFNKGTSVTVTATPNAGYGFVSWSEAGASVSSTPSYTFTASASRNLAANFALLRVITTASAPTYGGTTVGGGTFNDGTSVTVTATPSVNYAFDAWTEAGKSVSTTASYTFVASKNRTLSAKFVRTYVVTTRSLPSTGGKTSGGGTFKVGTNATVTATPNAGYKFVNWTVGGVEASTLATYSFAVTGTKKLTANFIKK